MFKLEEDSGAGGVSVGTCLQQEGKQQQADLSNSLGTVNAVMHSLNPLHDPHLIHTLKAFSSCKTPEAPRRRTL